MNPHSDSKISTSFFIQSIATVHLIRCYFRSVGEVTTNCHAYMISVHAQYIYKYSKPCFLICCTGLIWFMGCLCITTCTIGSIFDQSSQEEIKCTKHYEKNLPKTSDQLIFCKYIYTRF